MAIYEPKCHRDNSRILDLPTRSPKIAASFTTRYKECQLKDVGEEIGLPDDAFDAITMSHAVEHLPDPIGTLRECKRILKKGGRLVVTVPNIESLGHRLFREAYLHLDPPRHLFLFSPHTLRICLEHSGLQILKLHTTARSARSTWAASRLIHRNGILPGGSPPEQSLGLRTKGLAFQAVEHGVCWVSAVGEEIVVMTTK